MIDYNYERRELREWMADLHVEYCDPQNELKTEYKIKVRKKLILLYRIYNKLYDTRWRT